MKLFLRTWGPEFTREEYALEVNSCLRLRPGGDKKRNIRPSAQESMRVPQFGQGEHQGNENFRASSMRAVRTDSIWFRVFPDGSYRRFARYGEGPQWSGHPKCDQDRKSTRLNSSHGYISYAVF